MIQRRHLQLDGLGLSYLERGTAVHGQPTIVLLHGLMGCADTFLPLMRAFETELHVIALDLPGAGQSERRRDIDPSLLNAAELVGRFVAEIGAIRPIVVGHSHGGAVAMSLAARHRDTMRSLVLLAPAHPYFKEANPLIRFYLSLPGRMFAYTMPWYPRWMQMLGLRRMAGPQSWDAPERLNPYRDNLRTPGTISHLLRLLRTWNKDMSGLRRALRTHLKTPTLVLWGDSDRAVPVESAPDLRRHFERSELLIVPGVGHRPAEERPKLIAEFLQQWLERDTTTAGDADSIRYSANSSASQVRIAPLRTSSFEAGD
jgi:pimeloyl-ACP methyl ester carboxylesterase